MCIIELKKYMVLDPGAGTSLHQNNTEGGQDCAKIEWDPGQHGTSTV